MCDHGCACDNLLQRFHQYIVLRKRRLINPALQYYLLPMSWYYLHTMSWYYLHPMSWYYLIPCHGTISIPCHGTISIPCHGTISIPCHGTISIPCHVSLTLSDDVVCTVWFLYVGCVMYIPLQDMKWEGWLYIQSLYSCVVTMVTEYVYSTVACFIKHYCIIQSTFHLPCLLPIPTCSPTSAHLSIPTTHL